MSIVVRSPSWRAARSWLAAAAVVALLLAALAGPSVASADDGHDGHDGHDGSTWLVDVAVTAQTSDPTSVTVFSAVWINRQGDGPDYIRVAIDGVDHDLAPTSDASFRTGRPYALSTTLPPGDHSIVFSAGGRDRFTAEVAWGTVSVPEAVDPGTGGGSGGGATGDAGSGDSAGSGSNGTGGTGTGTGTTGDAGASDSTGSGGSTGPTGDSAAGGDTAGSGGTGSDGGAGPTGDASGSGGTGDATGTGSGDTAGHGGSGGSGAGDGSGSGAGASTGDGSGSAGTGSGTGDGSGSGAGGSTGDGTGAGGTGDGTGAGGTGDGSGGSGSGAGSGAGGSTGSGHGSGHGPGSGDRAGSGTSGGTHQAVDATSTTANGRGSRSTRTGHQNAGSAAGVAGDPSPDARPVGWAGPDDPAATVSIASVTDPTTGSTTAPTVPDGGRAAGRGGGAGEGSGRGTASAPDGLTQLGLGHGFAERNLTAIPVALTTTGVVVVWAAFMMFGKKRRDDEPPAPDAVLSVHAAAVVDMPVSALVPPPLPPGVDPSEAALPRWRRPSLLEARKKDPLRSASMATTLTFANGAVEAVAGKERRRIRYRLVRLMDVPDELRANEIGILDEGDEVQILETSGIYRLVLCPDGGQGWLHKMVLGDIVSDAGDEPLELVPAGIDEDVLSAYLAHRQKTA